MHTTKSIASILSVGAIATAFAAPHAASAEGAKSVYRLNAAVDIPLLGLGLAGTSAAFIETDPAACLPNCTPPDNLNALDRLALGHYSPTAHRVADVLVLTLALSPALWDVIDTRSPVYFEDMVVHGEVLALTQGLTQITKFAVGRVAPFVYSEAVPLEERMGSDAHRSFWSGHTATAFASATSYSVTYFLRHPRDPWRFTVLGTNLAAALAVGFLKIHAGYHYPTDILAGALVGASIGTMVPLLHHSFD